MQLIFFWVTQSNKTITIYAHKLSGPILNNGLIKSKQCTSTTNWLNLEQWASKSKHCMPTTNWPNLE